MTGTVEIPAGETGVVRVFAIDLPGPEADAFAKDPAALAHALGVAGIDADHVDVFAVSTLAGFGLPTFLTEGHGVPAEALAADAATLGALTGHVAVVSSRAFGGRAQTLTIAPPLRLVGSYSEERSTLSFGTLPSGGAEGVLSGPPVAAPPPPPRGGRAGKFILILILAAAFVAMAFLSGNR